MGHQSSVKIKDFITVHSAVNSSSPCYKDSILVQTHSKSIVKKCGSDIFDWHWRILHLKYKQQHIFLWCHKIQVLQHWNNYYSCVVINGWENLYWPMRLTCLQICFSRRGYLTKRLRGRSATKQTQTVRCGLCTYAWYCVWKRWPQKCDYTRARARSMEKLHHTVNHTINCSTLSILNVYFIIICSMAL